MAANSDWDHLELETPARYRIRVLGHMDSSWSNKLGGLVVSRAFTQKKQPMTILVGELLDQAALSGVLTTLHNINFKLLSVENLDE